MVPIRNRKRKLLKTNAVIFNGHFGIITLAILLNFFQH